MTNKIYYFTGRGNSLAAALELSKRLDSPMLIPIRNGADEGEAEETDSIGIFTPVIDIGIPAYVLKFVDRLQVKNIRLEGGRPIWLHSCEQCAACFSWCPNEAITGTNLASRTHYRNSCITLDQMLNRPQE